MSRKRTSSRPYKPRAILLKDEVTSARFLELLPDLKARRLSVRSAAESLGVNPQSVTHALAKLGLKLGHRRDPSRAALRRKVYDLYMKPTPAPEVARVCGLNTQGVYVLVKEMRRILKKKEESP